MSDDEVLGARRRALEESYFAKENEKLRLALRRKEALKAAKANLAEVSGITDDAVLDHLLELEIGGDTLTALSLVTLVEVAWANGSVEEHEREAVLAAADDAGLPPDGPGRRLLGDWLLVRPDPELHEAWREYVQALSATLSDAGKQALKDNVMSHARAVAEAAGGFLGVHKISGSEQAVLDELERTFS